MLLTTLFAAGVAILGYIVTEEKETYMVEHT